MKRRIVAAAVLSAAGIATLAGCGNFGESNSHNAPFPAVPDVSPSWTRIDDPSGYPTIMHACFGRDGIYVGHQGSVITVVPDDPECRA